MNDINAISDMNDAKEAAPRRGGQGGAVLPLHCERDAA